MAVTSWLSMTVDRKSMTCNQQLAKKEEKPQIWPFSKQAPEHKKIDALR